MQGLVFLGKLVDPDLGVFIGLVVVDQGEITADVGEGVFGDAVVRRHVVYNHIPLLARRTLHKILQVVYDGSAYVVFPVVLDGGGEVGHAVVVVP